MPVTAFVCVRLFCLIVPVPWILFPLDVLPDSKLTSLTARRQTAKTLITLVRTKQLESDHCVNIFCFHSIPKPTGQQRDLACNTKQSPLYKSAIPRAHSKSWKRARNVSISLQLPLREWSKEISIVLSLCLCIYARTTGERHFASGRHKNGQGLDCAAPFAARWTFCQPPQENISSFWIKGG